MERVTGDRRYKLVGRQFIIADGGKAIPQPRVLNRPRDALTVLRAKDKCAENQQIERPLQKFKAVGRSLGRHLTRVLGDSGKMST